MSPTIYRGFRIESNDPGSAGGVRAPYGPPVTDSMLRPAPKPSGGKRAPKGLKRTRMKQRNAKRKGSAFPKRRDLRYQAFVRGFPCILAWPLQKGYHDGRRMRWHRCIGGIQFCHIKSRGAGGDDVGNAYPGCAAAHDEQHRIGIPAFEARYNLDLRKFAQQLAALYPVEAGPLRAGTDPQ